MLSILEQSDKRLLLGPRRTDELVGLSLTGLGLLAVCFGLVAIFEYRKLGAAQVALTAVGCFYILPLGAVGLLVLLNQRRYIIDREQGLVIYLRWARQPQTWQLDQFEYIHITRTTEYGGHLDLQGRGRDRVRIGTGGLKDCERIAQALQQLLNLRIERSYRRDG